MEGADAAASLERALSLRRIPGLEALDPELLTTLAAHVELRRLAAGHRLAGPGDGVRSLHFVLEGSLGAASGEGARYGPGALVATRAADPLGRGAVALEESATLAFDLDALIDLCEEHFAILLAVIRGLARATLGRSRASLSRRDPPPDGLPAPLAGGARAPHDLGERIAFLASCPTFAGIPVHAIGQLAQSARPLGLRPGERLWSVGDPADWALAVCEGAIAAAGESERFEIGPGAIAGLLESIAGEPRWYGAEARTRVVGLAIDIASVYDAAEDDSETAADLLAALARSWLVSARAASA